MYAWGALVGTLMTEPCFNVHALQVKIPLPGTARVSEGDSGKEDGHNLSMFNPPLPHRTHVPSANYPPSPSRRSPATLDPKPPNPTPATRVY